MCKHLDNLSFSYITDSTIILQGGYYCAHFKDEHTALQKSGNLLKVTEPVKEDLTSSWSKKATFFPSHPSLFCFTLHEEKDTRRHLDDPGD